jgi:hypothetical protein
MCRSVAFSRIYRDDDDDDDDDPEYNKHEPHLPRHYAARAS